MRKVIEITSRDNPAVKHYLRLRDKKKYRQEEKLFIIEGLRIIRDALQYPYLVQQIFLTSKYEEEFQGAAGQIYRIPESIGKVMADTEHPQGIFAVCRMSEQKQKLSSSGRYLVLCQLQDPGNMGMILRTCDALGVDGVFITQCCDLYSPKAIRSTMGSVFRVPVTEVSSPEELLNLLRQNQITSYASVPSENALKLTDCQFQPGCAVWIGNEGNGLPEEIISACQAITIPMKGGAESLNAAMAAGILLWEMRK